VPELELIEDGFAEIQNQSDRLSQLVDYDARILSFTEKDWTVSLTLRVVNKLALGNYQVGKPKAGNQLVLNSASTATDCTTCTFS